MSVPRLLLVHGAATTAAVWDRLRPLLVGHDVSAPQRPRSGSLPAELAFLGPLARDAWVVGMSGGATLGLALAATEVPLRGAVLHEPAVGSLLPGLLAPMATAFASGGTAAFGQALYGDSWSPAMAGGTDDAVTATELAMFRAFEPGRLSERSGRVVVTYGGCSPAVRKEAAYRLAEAVGCEVREVPGAAHFVAHDAPEALAAVLRDVLT